jgi:pimeloyl-ACP methyl ester carboxylesterase
MTTYVLVHGAWGGGWKFARVAERLRRRGHIVFTPTLTGAAERSHLLSGNITLSTHVTDILNVFRYEDLSDVVLLGHSYGGMVITAVADKIAEKIAALVYLDAFVPENGQSLFDLNIPANT